MIDSLLNLGIPYAGYIGISGIQNPFIVFVLCIIIGVALYLIGRGGYVIAIASRFSFPHKLEFIV